MQDITHLRREDCSKDFPQLSNAGEYAMVAEAANVYDQSVSAIPPLTPAGKRQINAY